MQARAGCVGEQRGGDGRHGQEEGGAEVGVQLAEEAEGRGEGDALFDVEVEALDFVFLQDGDEGVVVGVELGGVSSGVWMGEGRGEWDVRMRRRR